MAARVGRIAAIVGTLGAWFIFALIFVLGRRRRWRDVPWLAGPVGGDTIGDAPYRDVAEREGLALERRARDGGLLPDFAALAGDSFDPARVHPLVREFYEHTTEFAMDVWSRTYFPASLALALLVTTISRQVDQLNFPLSPLDTAHGITSEIVLLRAPDGDVRYAGWFRTLARSERVLYTGFYMAARVPGERAPCVKVVFPMPRGNATVVLRPEARADGSFVLDSSGRAFGGAGFYRVQARDADRVRVWRVRTLRERFHLYVDDAGVLRCDHTIRFLGMPVLALHYKMSRRGQ
jgi:hypothetical protein